MEKAITGTIIKDLIISCSVPPSLFENPTLQSFMWVVDVKYCLVNQGTVTWHVSEPISVKQSNIKLSWGSHCLCHSRHLDWQKHTSIIECDSSFHEDGRKDQLKERFTGSNTGERISDTFEQVCISFIALGVTLLWKWGRPSQCVFYSVASAESEEDDLENPSLWEEVADNYQAVCDWLKATNALNSPLAKVTKSVFCGLKEAFKAEYGANHIIPSATSVRWNSTLQFVEAVIH